MKTKQLITIISLFLTFQFFAQVNSKRLAFELNAGLNQFAMKDFNQNYIKVINQMSTDTPKEIKSGMKYQLSISYRPKGLFEFGLYGNYQFNASETVPIDYGLYSTNTKKRLIRADAISFGVTSTFYVSHLMKMHEKLDSSNRFHFGVDVSGGVGFSSLFTAVNFYYIEQTSPWYSQQKSQGFQGQIGLRFEYEFLKKPVFSSVGIKGGFQFFKTTMLKNYLGESLTVYGGSEEIYLDFSGLYFGVYLKLGK